MSYFSLVLQSYEQNYVLDSQNATDYHIFTVTIEKQITINKKLLRNNDQGFESFIYVN